MCGIYACLGDAMASQKVLAGLKRIEYRGYDSWGIAICDRQIKIEKHVGKIGEVKKLTLADSATAIGHTRWATHGGVTENNAHPHLAQNGSFALVQNGVLENYQELKEELQQSGYKFHTETDTEVIVALIETTCKTKIEAPKIQQVIKRLAGRNTILLLTQTGEVWAYRQGSPLIVGQGKNDSYFFSSDLASISHDALNYHVLENGELVHFAGQLQNFSGQKITFQKINHKSLSVDKGDYKHFMFKEIHEQPDSLQKVILNKQNLFASIAKEIDGARNIYVVGAGSASYAAMSIVFELRQHRQNICHLAAYDYSDYNNLFSEKDLAIVLSQSGETADTIEAVEVMKRSGVKIVSVVNMPGSSLLQMADLAYPLDVGAEIGVASTKALTGHMLFGMALAEYLVTKDFAFAGELAAYCKKLAAWLTDPKITFQIKTVAKFLSQKDDLYILGRGRLLPSALEFALKIKEVAYLHAEGFSAGELKHGVIALIEKNTPVVCLVAADTNKNDMISAAHEVKARGAKVIGLASQNEEVFDYFIELPKMEKFTKLSSVIVAQLLTYEIALLKKLDPDKPRNLAKSVTVK